MVIENRGYDSFNTSPQYFVAVVSNARYSFNAGRSNLEAVDLPDGGKISGTLAFQVPSGAGSNKVSYSLMYSGVRLYNVQWFEKP
jgi:hypothetical protein